MRATTSLSRFVPDSRAISAGRSSGLLTIVVPQPPVTFRALAAAAIHRALHRGGVAAGSVFSITANQARDSLVTGCEMGSTLPRDARVA